MNFEWSAHSWDTMQRSLNVTWKATHEPAMVTGWRAVYDQSSGNYEVTIETESGRIFSGVVYRVEESPGSVGRRSIALGGLR
jgi:hypothetical protein